MNCYSCNKEINEENSINGICKECNEKILKKINEESIKNNKTSKSPNDELKILFIVLTIITIPIFILAFILITKYSPAPKLSKNEYIEKCENITYEKLARNPSMYEGNNYIIKGKVIQIQESYSNDIQLLIYVTEKKLSSLETSDFENLMYITYEYESNSENRILDGDIITIYGECKGSKTYTTVLGSSNTVPYINALYIDINE